MRGIWRFCSPVGLLIFERRKSLCMLYMGIHIGFENALLSIALKVYFFVVRWLGSGGIDG